jgi:cytochrome c5
MAVQTTLSQLAGSGFYFFIYIKEVRNMKTFKFLPLVAALALVACGQKAPASPEASNERIAPVAAPVEVASAPAAAPAAPAASAAAAAAPAASETKTASAGDLATGEKVFTATCQACHGTGVMGAPKFGDKAAWGPRIAKGKEALYTSALNGFKMMPPKGGNAGLKDEEVKAAVDYMVSKAS